ncbi:hypothetical protein CRG98_020209 [Punica granatum]|uniref:Uncharacterized protein n=1 Tax=Punica granatum TaxID=22663 RepID=A0A2I0JSV3_PUNGR|nr:hypothetical protein CRG98_020209 [Punica granatum]
MDTKSWTRSPGREVLKAVKMDTKSWTRSPKSGKDRREVLDAKSEKRDNRLSLVMRLWVCLAKLTCAPFRVLHPDRDCDLSNETDIRPLGGTPPGTCTLKPVCRKTITNGRCQSL